MVSKEGVRVSTLDLVQPKWVLLTEDERWCAAARGVCALLELTLNCVVVGDTAAASAQGAITLTLDTPIEQIARNPAGMAALDANLPQVVAHARYDTFKSMSLRQLQPLSQGQITEEALAATELQLATVVYGVTPPDPEDPEAFRNAFGIGPAGASLIRPDGYIAWRSIEFPLDPMRELAAALHHVSFAMRQLHQKSTTDVVQP
jgi:hypothetical protein